jgi:hypothetical protein
VEDVLMRKMDDAKWKEAQILYEDFGMNPEQIARNFDVSRPLVDQRISKFNWVKPEPGKLTSPVKAAAIAKAQGVERVKLSDMTRDAMKEVEKRLAQEGSQIIALHREDWQAHRQVFGACATTDIEQARAAKASAEAIILRQKGERETWDIVSNRSSTDSYEEQLKQLVKDADSVQVSSIRMEFGNNNSNAIEGEFKDKA